MLGKNMNCLYLFKRTRSYCQRLTFLLPTTHDLIAIDSRSYCHRLTFLLPMRHDVFSRGGVWPARSDEVLLGDTLVVFNALYGVCQ